MRRDPWLDNVKMVLVTLVVFGHTLGLALVSDRNIQVYNWLYYFHIPAFVLLSGHLSRNFAWDRRHLTSLFTTVALPYLLFEPALWTFRVALGQREDGPLWLQPHWAMWYLCVLFFWRLASPVLRHRAALPLSLVVGLAGGMLDTELSCIPRILGLLPFFVLGLHLERRHLTWVRDRFPRPLAVVVLLAIFVWAGHTDEWARARVPLLRQRVRRPRLRRGRRHADPPRGDGHRPARHRQRAGAGPPGRSGSAPSAPRRWSSTSSTASRCGTPTRPAGWTGRPRSPTWPWPRRGREHRAGAAAGRAPGVPAARRAGGSGGPLAGAFASVAGWRATPGWTT